ncbi:MAG: PEP-CTERM sorting domain-containing protein [Pirellulales bacterium]|nr:PEP-CTERM sorting domain-containing protein [Pirellulales bacterium]
MKRVFGLLLLCFVASPVAAQITVDGTKDGAYGGPLAVQTVETQFGDNFSELDAGYGRIDGGRLYLMLAGNIEANFNKLEIFIDSKAGGQSVFDSSGNDNAGNMDGLMFDVGFTADYHVIARRGDAGGPRFDLDFANLGAQSASSHLDFLVGGGDAGAGSTGTGVNASPIEVGYDGSNTAGVLGGTAAADQTAAAAVTTGLELSIALSDLGYAGGPIQVMVGQNNQNHDFWSNQFLGGIPPQGNLGGPGAKNFATIDGNQFFTVVPEPATAALVGLAGLALALFRRK